MSQDHKKTNSVQQNWWSQLSTLFAGSKPSTSLSKLRQAAYVSDDTALPLDSRIVELDFSPKEAAKQRQEFYQEVNAYLAESEQSQNELNPPEMSNNHSSAPVVFEDQMPMEKETFSSQQRAVFVSEELPSNKALALPSRLPLDQKIPPLVFAPPLDPVSQIIPRIRELRQLEKAFLEVDAVLLSGHAGCGKTMLATLYAREAKFANSMGVIGATVTPAESNLAELLSIVLREQFGFPANKIQDPIALFSRLIADQGFLVVISNLDLLPSSDRKLLSNLPWGLSKLLASTCSSKLRLEDWVIPVRVIDVLSLSEELVQTFALEQLPEALENNASAMAQVLALIDGNPLNLSLFTSFVKRFCRPNARIPQSKQLEDLLLASKRQAQGSDFLISLSLKDLSSVEKDILFFCSHLPVVSINESFIEQIFSLPQLYAERHLSNLFERGLIQKIFTLPGKNFSYRVHSRVQEFVFKEFQLDPIYFDRLKEGIVLHFTELLSDPVRLKRTSSSFVTSGLLYFFKMFLRENAQTAELFPFFEKALAYLTQMKQFEKIENVILPIFLDNLGSTADLPNKAGWQKMLGLAYLSLAETKIRIEDRLEALKRGLLSLNQSLSLYAALPSQSAKQQEIYNELGKAHLLLHELTQSPDALDQAVEFFGKAIKIQSFRKDNLLAGSYGLSHSYLALSKLKPVTAQLQASIDSFTQLSKNQKLEKPEQARLEEELGRLHMSVAAREKATKNFQLALGHLKEALSSSDDQQIRSNIYNDLGCCYWRLARHESREENIELAIENYALCLALITKYKFPIDCATILSNLATAYKALAVLKNPEENMSTAINHYREALLIAERYEQHALIKVINRHLDELGSMIYQNKEKNSGKPLLIAP